MQTAIPKNSVLSASNSSDLESDVMEEEEDESDIDHAALPITDDDESN